MADQADQLQAQIRQARGKFAAMAGTYSLGVFNDQFYKQAACLLAIAAGLEQRQGHIIIYFTLPYILLAAPAGWLADRFSKGVVVRLTKALELVAMTCGGVGIVMDIWPMVAIMAFLMGLQSALFSPALNGSIPELYPASYVTQANGILKSVVTVMILLGVALAGPVLDLSGPEIAGVGFGRWAVGGAVICIAILGVIGSLGVPRFAPADPTAKFPWTGPWDTLKELWKIRKDSLLAVTIGADVFVWFIGSLQIQLINVMGEKQLGLGKTLTSALVAAVLVGIAIGGLLAAKLAGGPRWYRVLVPASLRMAAATFAVTFVTMLGQELQLPVLLVLLSVAGMAGGLFMIPCESFIQVRPPRQKKGAVIAAANFGVFSGILLTGFLANALNERFQPTASFSLVGVISLMAAALLYPALRREDKSK